MPLARVAVLALVLLAPGLARAEFRPAPEPELARQIQIDGGLSIAGLAFEQPVSPRLAVAVGAGIMSTYFAPWFDAGDRVDGFCGELRVTWFARTTGRGLYVAPFFRVGRVTGERDDAEGDGWGVSTGAFVGWTFALGRRFDLRVGGGVQYFHYVVETAAGDVEVTTPFVAIDAVLGFRL
jgi:hypothetical protein